MANVGTERVLSVRHWTPTQFTFTTTRRSGSALRERPVPDGGPGRCGTPGAARLQHRQCQPRGAPGVPEHQGAGRPADLAPATHPKRRRGAGQPQADRYAAGVGPEPGAAAVPAQHRHGRGTLHGPHQGPRGLCTLRAGDPGPRGALGRRERGDRQPDPRAAAARTAGRGGARPADVLPVRDARAACPPRPAHPAHAFGRAVRRPRHPAPSMRPATAPWCAAVPACSPTPARCWMRMACAPRQASANRATTSSSAPSSRAEEPQWPPSTSSPASPSASASAPSSNCASARARYCRCRTGPVSTSSPRLSTLPAARMPALCWSKRCAAP